MSLKLELSFLPHPAIELAEKYKTAGVVAVDLAGPEAFKTGDNYSELFDEAKTKGLNITIHAGEACGSEEVLRAIDLLHAQRIGHGVHLEPRVRRRSARSFQRF